MVRKDERSCPSRCSPPMCRWVAVPMRAGLRDVTERRAMEEALRASEAQFATFFRVVALGLSIARVDDGVLVNVNRTLLETTGYTRAPR